jgi:uncharacterized membrane protein
MMYGNNMGTEGWIFSILGTVIIVALIIAAVLWIASNQSAGAKASAESSGELLDRRLASGEITSGQYEELRERLGAARGNQQPRSRVGTPG